MQTNDSGSSLQDSNWNIFEIGVSNNGNAYPMDPYFSPAPDSFPIIAMFPVPEALLEVLDSSDGEYDAALLRTMEYVMACGCNTAILQNSRSQIERQLKIIQMLSKNTGGSKKLNVLIHSDSLCESIQESVKTISSFRSNQFVKGWFVLDSPKHWDWGNVMSTDVKNQRYNALTLGYRTATIYCKCNGKSPATAEQLTFFSLPASSEPLWIGECQNYEQYLKVINLLFKPSLWTYDFFPFTTSDSTATSPSGVITNHQEFYGYLEKYSEMAKSTGSAFWARCDVNEYKLINTLTGKTTYESPKLTLGMLRFMVFSMLAYGAKGIIYSYIGLPGPQRSSGSLTTTSFESAPLTYSQKITLNGSILISQIYTDLKIINEELDSCSKILTNCNLVSTSHFGKNYGFPGILPIGPLNNVQTGGEGVCIALLEHSNTSNNTDNAINKGYLMIVNHDPMNSQSVSLSLDSGYSYSWHYISSSPDSPGTDVISEKTSLTSTDIINTTLLPPGGKAILEFESNKTMKLSKLFQG